MSSSALAERLFVGPAMVVDDHIRDQDSNMRPIVDQIQSADIPVFEYSELPALNQVKHWRGFSLIVLDWELVPLGVSSSSAEHPAENGDFLGALSNLKGISVPEGLGESVKADVAGFVKSLFTQLYCPIFVFSDQSIDLIWDELVERTQIAREQLEARVLVRSKSDMSSQLFDVLGTWLEGHPAMYAVRSWEEGYEHAKKDLFQELQTSSLEWPRILWSASAEDDANEHFELTETISQNILHRFAPLSFDSKILGKELHPGPVDIAALRRVVHRQAVIDAKSLHSDVLMPGDFFYGEMSDTGIPLTIDICLTPACDLVARGVDRPDIELVVVTAKLVPDLEQKKESMRESMRKRETTTSQLIYVLTESARPYKVQFSSWRRTTWGEVEAHRAGRLLEPYVNHLLQKFGLFFQRQGLPHLPATFHYVPSAADLEAATEALAKKKALEAAEASIALRLPSSQEIAMPTGRRAASVAAKGPEALSA